MRQGRATTAARIAQRNMLKVLQDEGLSFPPFTVEVRLSAADSGEDGRLRIRGAGLDVTFAFACETEWNRRKLQARKTELRDKSQRVLPMIIFPHLTDERLQDLQNMRLSGLDLSGNGILFDPPRLFVLRTGFKARFKSPPEFAAIYRSRHISSLVARVVFVEPYFPTVRSVLDACQRRMMPLSGRPHALSLPTVSKALGHMSADLVITRLGPETRLRDPERLLAQLERSFQMPAHVQLLGKTALAPHAIWAHLKTLSPRARAVVTGRGSAGHYTGLAGPERLRLYVSDAVAVSQALDLKPTTSFPNIELLETPEESPYFDAHEHDGVVWASPLQTYLELQCGDAREQDAAQKIRAELLRRPLPP